MNPTWLFSNIFELRRLVLTGNGLSSAEKLVLVTLCSHADAIGFCWPSVKLIAYETSLSLSTVGRALRRLRELGLVKSKRRVRGYDYTISKTRLEQMEPSVTLTDDDAGDGSPSVLESSATVTDEDDSHRSPRQMLSVTTTNVIGHRDRSKEKNHRRETKEVCGDTHTSFQSFWELVPTSKRKRRGQVKKTWDLMPEYEHQLAVAWLMDAVAADEDEVPEALWILRDQRWEDAEWPMAAGKSRDELVYELRAEHGREPWWEEFVGWVLEDPSRPVDPEVFLNG